MSRVDLAHAARFARTYRETRACRRLWPSGSARALRVSLAVVALCAPGARADHPIDLIAPVDGPIVRHFEAPATPFGPGHRGLDFASDEGAPVVAADRGVVSYAGRVGGALFVSIDHAGGLRTTYSFLSSILVARGAEVAQGDVVATSGAGHPGSDEPHLHFGLRRGDEYLDPEPVLIHSMRLNQWRVLSLIE